MVTIDPEIFKAEIKIKKTQEGLASGCQYL
jgi:hypothetical protein